MPNGNIPENLNVTPVNQTPANIKQSNKIFNLKACIYISFTIFLTLLYILFLYINGADPCTGCVGAAFDLMVAIPVLIFILLITLTFYGYLKSTQNKMNYLVILIIFLILSYIIITNIAVDIHKYIKFPVY